MARDGYRIFDSDTHVGPDARIRDLESRIKRTIGIASENILPPKGVHP